MVMVVLLVDQARRQFAGMMIVYQRNDGDLFGIRIDRTLRFFVNEMVADEIAYGLAACGIAARRDVAVERGQQRIIQRDANSCEVGHNRSVFESDSRDAERSAVLSRSAPRRG